MAGKLVTNVFVGGTWYGPNDRVPPEVAEHITNPKVWAEPPVPDAEPKAEPTAAEMKEPPRGGPGSSAEAWRNFMVVQEFDVPENATAKDMQAAWDNRDKG